MKDWPIYYKDFLIQGDEKSDVGICTLWTPKEDILSNIDKDYFCLGGQLYSKRGINFILRNILAKPNITKIILCGSDRSGSGETLIKLVKNGIDEDFKVINDKKCDIQKEIDRSAVDDFRKNIKLIDLRGKINPEEIRKKLNKTKSKKMWSKPRVFKDEVVNVKEKLPSEKTSFMVRSDYIWEAWIQILRLIMKFGSKKGMIKIGEVRELVNIISVIEKENPNDPEVKDIFDFSYKDLKLYYKDFFKSTRGSESYNYGERIYNYPCVFPRGKFNSEKNQSVFEKLNKIDKNFKEVKGLDQLAEVFEKYKRYHEDRGLVISIWNPWVDNIKQGWMADKKKENEKIKGGNVPCMAMLQFTYRSKKLHLTAYFRSNDMFDAWPRNAFVLRKLQFDFAKKIGKKPGYLTTISNCAQIYKTNYSKTKKILKKYKDRTFCRPDPRGACIVEVEGEDIVVKHMSPDGNHQLGEYKINGNVKKAALKLMDILINNYVFAYKYNVSDIAIELTKAEWCIKRDKKFIQDRDWDELTS